MQVVMDTKDGSKAILADQPIVLCKSCGKEMRAGSSAYYADFEKAVYCRICMGQGAGSDANTIFYWGVITQAKEQKTHKGETNGQRPVD